MVYNSDDVNLLKDRQICCIFLVEGDWVMRGKGFGPISGHK